MEHRVARELLGLDPDEPLAHDRVRRAYLRRLRLHPPERDPDGFRRLREAFELLELLARWAESPVETAPASRRPAAAFDELETPAPGEVALRLGEMRAPIPVRTFAPPGAHDEPANDGPDEPTADDLEVPDDPWILVRSEAARQEPLPPPPPPAPPVIPVAIHRPDEPPTLDAVTAEILALLGRGRLDAALKFGDFWQRSALDDHRQVSERAVWRWALTRELLDVATVLPSALLRAIAQAIASDELAPAHQAAERYRTVNPARARDLAVHFEKRAGNLHKLFGSRLGPRAPDPVVRAKPSGGRRSPIWVAVIIASALVRAATTCHQEPAPSRQLDHFQAPSVPMKLDAETLRKLRNAVDQAQSRP